VRTRQNFPHPGKFCRVDGQILPLLKKVPGKKSSKSKGITAHAGTAQGKQDLPALAATLYRNAPKRGTRDTRSCRQTRRGGAKTPLSA
jgi:hypothetical protein